VTRLSPGRVSRDVRGAVAADCPFGEDAVVLQPTDGNGRPGRFTRHVLEQAMRRGTTPDEIVDALRTGMPDTARAGYLGMAKVYPFAGTWRGRYYPEKRVRVIFVVEADETIVVTVYAYYGSWSR
jgi:hypothetical protein